MLVESTACQSWRVFVRHEFVMNWSRYNVSFHNSVWRYSVTNVIRFRAISCIPSLVIMHYYQSYPCGRLSWLYIPGSFEATSVSCK